MSSRKLPPPDGGGWVRRPRLALLVIISLLLLLVSNRREGALPRSGAPQTDAPVARDSSADLLFIWTDLATPFSSEALKSVRSAAAHSGAQRSGGAAAPARVVKLLCMTLSCYESRYSLPESVDVSMISVRDFLGAESPAAGWFRNHTWNKVASGVKYPLLFRRMVLLSALHEFGGTAVEFGGTVRAPAPPPSGSPRCADVGGQAVTLYAPRGHEKVRAAIADLAAGFLELAGQQKWRGSCPFASRAPRGHSWIDFDNGPAVFSPNPGQHYGVLWHDTLVRYQLTHKDGPNLGDEVQMLAAAQWLPYIDARVDRDNMTLVTPATAAEGSILLIMNAFWGYKPTGTLWPAPAFIDPILVSMHFYPPMYPEFGSKDSLAYMKAHAPVGTRDTQTLGFLQAKMPPASSYLSLCLTSTLESVARPGAVPECPVLLVDVPDELLPLLPPAINRKACRMAAKLYDNRTMDGMFRVGHAFDHLTRYARAGVVITTRLHCGVPAAAMGIPVILVKHPEGFTGRFDGFHPLFHTIDIWEQRGKAKAFLRSFDYDSPPPIPAQTGATPEWRKMRCGLLERIAAHSPVLLDSIYAQSLTPAFERCQAFQKFQLSGKGLLNI